MAPHNGSTELKPENSDLIAIAQQIDQPRDIARGMDSDIGLYATDEETYFLYYDTATLADLVGKGCSRPDEESIWPLSSESDWQTFIDEDLGRYRWAVLKEDRFEDVRKMAGRKGIPISEIENKRSQEMYALARIARRQEDERSAIRLQAEQDAEDSRILRLRPTMNKPHNGDTVMFLPVSIEMRRKVDRAAACADLSLEDYLRSCVEYFLDKE